MERAIANADYDRKADVMWRRLGEAYKEGDFFEIDTMQFGLKEWARRYKEKWGESREAEKNTPTKGRQLCSVCRQPGHNKRKCRAEESRCSVVVTATDC